MMVKTQKITRDDGVKLIRTYSSRGMKIRQNETGIVYDEAVDLENCGFTYEETDIKIESEVTENEGITED